MSKVFKKIGKVFKKVAKSTVGKIVIGALMVGAVVLTAGAAIPAVGSALGMGAGGIAGTLGLSGTLGAVVSGAVSAGALGAVTGGIMGAATGKGFFKGATGGFLMGAATGGLLGGISPGMMGPAGIFGNGFSAAGAGAAAPGAGSQAAATGGALLPEGGVGLTSGALESAVGATVPTATTATTTATTAGSGLLNSTLAPELLKVGGQIISGFAQGKAAEAEMKAKRAAEREEYDRIAYNYGYRNTYANKKDAVPSGQEAWYQYGPMNYEQPNYGLLQQAFASRPQAVPYQIVNGQVVQQQPEMIYG